MTPISCIVVSPRHPDEVIDAEVTRPVAGTALGTVVYARLPANFEIEFLDFTVDRLLGSRLDEADTVVVKCHRATFEALAAHPTALQRLLQRFPFARVLLLRWSPATATHELLDAAQRTPASDVGAMLIPLLRDLDFQIGLQEPGATLPANPEFHYEGPNGLHYERFLRAGYALQSTDAMEGAAFWLLPYIHRLAVIVLDSWTMLGFGYCIATYARSEAPQRMPWTPAVISAEEYAEGTHLQQRLAPVAETLGDARTTMIVTSVHSTGKSEHALREACSAVGLRVNRVVRLYANDPSPSGDRAVVTMHALAEPVVSSTAGACRSCLADRKSLVQVDRRSLLLGLTAAVEETRITRDAASAARRFVEDYGTTEALSVHRNAPSSDRHHMIYVDVERLLESDRFIERCRERIEQLRGRVQVVTSPTHTAAVALGKFAADALGVHFVPCEQQAYGNLSGDDRAALFSAEGILFVDDVSITGTRIRRVKQSLMQGRVVTDRKDADVFVLVGVARPSSANAWEGVSDYAGRVNVASVEYVELPNWGNEECPWCRELSLLGRHRAAHRLSDELTRRLARLEDVKRGLTDELFLHASVRAGGAVRALSRQPVTKAKFEAAQQALPPEFKVNREYRFSELGQGSIFGPGRGDVQLFVAVAASIQHLRSARRLSERSQYPLSRVLDPHLYFLGRFYANLIVACILRASRRRDLRTVDIEPVLRRAVGERLREAESLELRTELILAMAEGKLPWPQEMSLPEVFTEVDDSVREFALWLHKGDPAL